MSLKPGRFPPGLFFDCLTIHFNIQKAQESRLSARKYDRVKCFFVLMAQPYFYEGNDKRGFPL